MKDDLTKLQKGLASDAPLPYSDMTGNTQTRGNMKDDSSVSSSKVGAHTSGQWEVDGKNEDGGIDIVSRPTGCVLPWLIAMTATSLPVDEANARRIVACVNACIGIQIESLEQSRAVLMDSMDEAVAQRDELAEALSNLLTSFRQHEVNTGMPLLNGPLKAELDLANIALAKLDTDSTK